MADNKTKVETAKSQFNWSIGTGVVSAIGSVWSGILGGKTAKLYGDMQAKSAEMQAKLNTIATERNIAYQTRATADAIRDIKEQGRQTIGAQLAAMAASGMATASGSAQALLKSTGVSVGRDVSTLQANLMNSAYEQRRQTEIENIGLQYQAQAARAAGRQQQQASYIGAIGGVLSAANTVMAKWQTYQDTLAGQEKTPSQISFIKEENKLDYSYNVEDLSKPFQTSIVTPTAYTSGITPIVSQSNIGGLLPQEPFGFKTATQGQSSSSLLPSNMFNLLNVSKNSYNRRLR